MTERQPSHRTGEPTPAEDAAGAASPPHADQPVPRFDALGQEVPRFDALGVPETGRQEPSRPEPPPMPPRTTAPASPRPPDMPYGPYHDAPYQNGRGDGPYQNGHGNGGPTADAPPAPESPATPPPPAPPWSPTPPAAAPAPTPSPATPAPAPYERPDTGWPPAPPDILTGQPAYLRYDQENAAYATPRLQPQPDIAQPVQQYTGPPHQGPGDVVLPWEEPATADTAEAWYPPAEAYAAPPAPWPVREPAQERTAVRRSRHLHAPARPEGEHTLSLLSHLGGVLTGFLLPTVLYALFRSRSPFTRLHSAEAFNFQLTLMLGYVGAAILGVLVTGFVVLIPVWVVSLVFGIQAAVAADTGHEYRYPFIVRFID